MQTLPFHILSVLEPFRTLFCVGSTCSKAFLLVLGTILCRGGRTVCSALRVLGLQGERVFSKYHHVLNRAQWSSLQASRILLEKIIGDHDEPVILGIDGHLERRRGKKISSKGCYRDPVRSSRSYTVKCFGLKWLSVMVLQRYSWCQRVLALPFLTILMPSKKANQKAGKSHKTLLDWTCQVIKLLRKWLPLRQLILAADGEFAAAVLAWTCIKYKVSLVTRLRLDARLFSLPKPSKGRGRPAKKGQRLLCPKQILLASGVEWISDQVQWYGGITRTVQYITTTCMWHVVGYDPVPIRFVLMKDPFKEFQPVVLMSTDVMLTANKIIEVFVLRWNVEVTFREAREHLGIETQRQWSAKAILRSTPALFGIYSLVVLIADKLHPIGLLHPKKASWYVKEEIKFSDMLAAVRSYALGQMYFSKVGDEVGTCENIDPDIAHTLVNLLSQAI